MKINKIKIADFNPTLLGTLNTNFYVIWPHGFTEEDESLLTHAFI